MDHPSLVTPLLALAGGACLVLLFFFRKDEDGGSPAARVTAAAFLSAAFLVLAVWPENPSRDFHGHLLVDALGSLAALVVTLAGAITVGCASPWLRKCGADRAEVYAVLLLSAAGMVTMVQTDHLVTFFVGLETMSLGLYVLAAAVRERPVSVEAGMKYFLTGAFASGILLFGLALLYGATGSLALPEVADRLDHESPLALAGALLVLAGFGFKVSAAPFHQWAPDVYEGAPTPVTGFMATTVKVAAFVALVRVVGALGVLREPMVDALSWLAALTMVIGNAGALAQRSVKRVLAYSSISHAGYVLAGLAVLASVPAGDPAAGPARTAIVLYLVVYTIMNLGAFAVLGAVETSDGRGLGFEELGGLKQRHPVIAGCMLLFLLSLAGVPPTAGFLGKWHLFGSLLDRYAATGDRSWMVLIVFLAVSSVVGLAYYLRIAVAMYMTKAPEPLPVHPRPAWSAAFPIVLCAALSLWLGFGPTLLGLGADGLVTLVRQAAG